MDFKTIVPRYNKDVEDKSRGSSEAKTTEMTAEDWAKYGPKSDKKIKRHRPQYALLPKGVSSNKSQAIRDRETD